MRALNALLTGVLIGCVEPAAGPAGGGGGGGDGADGASRADTGLGTVEVVRPGASLSADDVAGALSATLAAGVPSPLLPRRQYLSVFEHRDERCPGGQGFNLPGHFAGCEAQTGWVFAGLAEYTGVPAVDVVDDFQLLADFTVTDAQGRPFVGGGELVFDVERGGGGLAWTGRVAGTWSWAAAEAWMVPDGAGAMLDLEVAAVGGGWSVQVDGSLTDGTHAVRIAGLEAASDTCEGAPTARFGLRGDAGYWYWLDATCGCGPVTFDGEPDVVLGEACVTVDLGALAREVR